MDALMLTNQQKTYIHQLRLGTEYMLEDLPGVMDDRDG